MHRPGFEPGSQALFEEFLRMEGPDTSHYTTGANKAKNFCLFISLTVKIKVIFLKFSKTPILMLTFDIKETYDSKTIDINLDSGTYTGEEIQQYLRLSGYKTIEEILNDSESVRNSIYRKVRNEDKGIVKIYSGKKFWYLISPEHENRLKERSPYTYKDGIDTKIERIDETKEYTNQELAKEMGVNTNEVSRLIRKGLPIRKSKKKGKSVNVIQGSQAKQFLSYLSNLLTVSEAAKELGVFNQRIQRQIDEGNYIPERLPNNNRSFIRRDDLPELKEQLIRFNLYNSGRLELIKTNEDAQELFRIYISDGNSLDIESMDKVNIALKRILTKYYEDITNLKIAYKVYQQESSNIEKILQRLEDNYNKKIPLSNVPALLTKFSNVEILTREEEKELFKEYNHLKKLREEDENFPLDQITRIRNAIALYNIKWVANRTQRMDKYSIDYGDRLINGFTGLLKAIDKFDLEKGNKFATYAQFWIDEYIRRGGKKETQVADRSLNEEFSEGITLESTLPNSSNHEKDLIKLDYLTKIRQIAKDTCNEKEWYILSNRFGFVERDSKPTFRKLGKELGVSGTRIEQIFYKTMKKLEKKIKEL